MEIEKTNRINSLLEFYSILLSEKQRNYLEFYYANDYSLGEIADIFKVSRQAIFDNIKRGEKLLEGFEEKLNLFANYNAREKIIENLQNKYSQDSYLLRQLTELQKIDDD